MISQNIIAIIYLILLVIFLLVHLPMDYQMHRKRDKSIPLTDYGIKSKGSITAILGLGSLVIGVIWFSIAIFHWNTNTSIIPYMLSFSDSANNIIQITGLIIMTLGVFSQSWARILRGKNSPSWGS